MFKPRHGRTDPSWTRRGPCRWARGWAKSRGSRVRTGRRYAGPSWCPRRVCCCRPTHTVWSGRLAKALELAHEIKLNINKHGNGTCTRHFYVFTARSKTRCAIGWLVMPYLLEEKHWKVMTEVALEMPGEPDPSGCRTSGRFYLQIQWRSWSRLDGTRRWFDGSIKERILTSVFGL